MVQTVWINTGNVMTKNETPLTDLAGRDKSSNEDSGHWLYHFTSSVQFSSTGYLCVRKGP